LIFLMISSRKHSFTAAAEFSKSSKSRFSKFLKHHSDLAVYKLIFRTFEAVIIKFYIQSWIKALPIDNIQYIVSGQSRSHLL
ncbi:MAG: hypothetical protein KJP07_03490, partial [Desulfatitalea sp.]|nr:hypothetical protein [Desulfatitalea sp.]